MRVMMLFVADSRAVGAIEAPETPVSANVRLPIAIEPMRRGEIKILLFIFVSPTQLDLRSLA